MHACGVPDIIAKMYGDDDDEAIVKQPVYLGGPFISDDVLFRRLDDRLACIKFALLGGVGVPVVPCGHGHKHIECMHINT